MSDLHRSFTNHSPNTVYASRSTSPTNSTVPSINIGGLPVSPNSPVNEFLGRSLDIKKQLLQSFHGHASSNVSSGGVTKPKLRRNSAYYLKAEDDDDHGTLAKIKSDEEGKEDQGIERKRRDTINEKIQELLTLIPEKYFQDQLKEGAGHGSANTGGAYAHSSNVHASSLSPKSASGPTSSMNQSIEEALAMAKSTGTRDGKPNKGQILTQAVEYIQFLQNLIDENNRKEVELFLKWKTLEKQVNGEKSAGANVPIAVEATSAEKALGEIGVGPESEAYFKKVLLESQGNYDEN